MGSGGTARDTIGIRRTGMPAAPSEACEIVIVDSMVALLYCLSVPISSRSDTTGVDSLPYPVEGLGGSESLSKAMGELVEDVELSSSAWVVGDETPSLRPAPPALGLTKRTARTTLIGKSSVATWGRASEQLESASAMMVSVEQRARGRTARQGPMAKNAVCRGSA